MPSKNMHEKQDAKIEKNRAWNLKRRVLRKVRWPGKRVVAFKMARKKSGKQSGQEDSHKKKRPVIEIQVQGWSEEAGRRSVQTGEQEEDILGTATMREIMNAAMQSRRTRTKSVTRSLQALSPFAPNLLKKHVVQHISSSPASVPLRDLPQETIASSMKECRGAVMVADVTGFTAMTERLSKEGIWGLEFLTKCMNSYFSKLMALVERFHGDVVKFAGDSLIIAFLPLNAESKTGDESMEAAVARSVACGWCMIKDLGEMIMLPKGQVISASSLRPRNTTSNRLSFSSQTTTFSSIRLPTVGSMGSSLSGSLGKYVSRAVQGLKSTRAYSDATSQSGNSTDSSMHSLHTGGSNETQRFHLSIKLDSDETGPWHSNAILWDDASQVMIGAGNVYIFNIGEEHNTKNSVLGRLLRWEFFLGDRPHQEIDSDGHRPTIQQISLIEGHASPGHLIVSREVTMVAGSSFKWDELSGGAARVLGVSDHEEVTHMEEPEWDQNLTALPTGSQMQCAKMLRMYLLDHVRDRLEAGHMDFINEVRRLTVVFLGFPSLSLHTAGGIKQPPDKDVEEVQSKFLEVQKTLDIFGGSLVQFRCDEKGFLAICAFGFPGKGHKDMESRGIQSALEIVKASENSAVVGVATGNLLCAWVGSKARAEYTVFGDAINLSARLMCKAKQGLGDVLCDQETRKSASEKACTFQVVDPLHVKGRSGKIQIYKVQTSRRRRHNTGLAVKPDSLFVGRKQTMLYLERELGEFLNSKKGGLVLIEGRKLVGKSAVLQNFQSRYYCSLQGTWMMARDTSKLFFGQGDDRQSGIVMHPWKNVLRDMYICAKSMMQELASSCVHSLIKPYPQEVHHLYEGLFDGLVVVSSQELESEDITSGCSNEEVVVNMGVSKESQACGCNEPTKKESDQEKSSGWKSSFSPVNNEDDSWKYVSRRSSRATSPAICKDKGGNLGSESGSETLGGFVESAVTLIQYFVKTIGSCVLLLEDLRKFDEVSLDILQRVTGQEGLLSIVTMRSFEEHTHYAPSTMTAKVRRHRKVQEYLRSHPPKLSQRLDPFDIEEATEVTKKISGCEQVSKEVVEAVMYRSGGLPVLVQQLSSYLIDEGLLEHGDEKSVEALSDGDAVADFIRKSVSVCHPLMDTIDGLTPSSHLTLKLIAIVEHKVTVELITRIYPYTTHFHAIERDFLELEDTGILRVGEEDEVLSLNFNCPVTRDVIYALIPNEQRRQLHAKVAEVMQGMVGVPEGTVAHHWTQSVAGLEAIEWKRTLKAMNRWEAAAEESLSQDDAGGALRALEQSIRLQDSLEEYYSKLEVPAETAVSKLILESAEPTPPTPQIRPNLKHISSFGRLMERVQSDTNLHDNTLANLPYISSLRRATAHRSAARLILRSNEDNSEKHMQRAVSHLLQAIYYLGAPSPDEEFHWEKKTSPIKALLRRATKGTKAGWRKVGRKNPGEKIHKLPVRRRPSMSFFLLRYLGREIGDLNRHVTQQELTEAHVVLDMLADVAVGSNDTKLKGYLVHLVRFFGGKHAAESPFRDIVRKVDSVQDC